MAEQPQTYEFDGRTVTMPVEVRDAAAGVAFFDVDASAAAELLPDAFDVIETAPGRAQVVIGSFDYRDNDLGDYHEVGITFFVRPAGTTAGDGVDGTFIWKLPVDQRFTCLAGCGIWGFPKTVEQIDVETRPDGGSLTTTLTMDGQLVMRLTVPSAGTDEIPPVEMTTYTLLDGRPHATPFTQGGTDGSITLGPDGVELELGDHPIAKELARLGLPGPATMSTWIGHMRGTFGEPRPL